MSLPLQGSSARVVLPHPRILIPIIAFDVLVPPLSSLSAVQPSSVLPTQIMTKPTISCPYLHMPFNICLREFDLPHPSHPTSLRLNVSHPPAKYFDLVHASQSPVSARRHSVSPSRRSHLRSIYLVFLLHRPQMTPSCFMVVFDLRGRHSQQMRVKLRFSRAHLPGRESNYLLSIAAHSISPFPASPPM
jgi:hypothetical protein